MGILCKECLERLEGVKEEIKNLVINQFKDLPLLNCIIMQSNNLDVYIEVLTNEEDYDAVFSTKISDREILVEKALWDKFPEINLYLNSSVCEDWCKYDKEREIIFEVNEKRGVNNVGEKK